MQHDDKEGRGSYDPPFEAHYKIKFNCDDCSGFAAAVETSISTSAPFIRSPTDYNKTKHRYLVGRSALVRCIPARKPLPCAITGDQQSFLWNVARCFDERLIVHMFCLYGMCVASDRRTDNRRKRTNTHLPPRRTNKRQHFN